ncbi:hypothetical protein [Fodinicola acaciae]|uniref:hypothetical protein n=1 Tax=Fodinicola acaciae TaxID=2681555 RepID=UPI0013D64524|nr:hypothetical protein [Fodinicola acaciae]
MAVQNRHRFAEAQSVVFPQGLLLCGDVEADTEYQSRDERAAGRPVRQRVDEVTGKRQWKGIFIDQSAGKAKNHSIEITFLADVQPVPAGNGETVLGMRPVELEGLQVSPRLVGQGEFKGIGWAYFATGFKQPAATGTAGTGKAAGKASVEAAGARS